MKFHQAIHKHLNQHHKKYLFGIFGSFAIVKTVILFAGFLGTFFFIQNETHAAFADPAATCALQRDWVYSESQ